MGKRNRERRKAKQATRRAQPRRQHSPQAAVHLLILDAVDARHSGDGEEYSRALKSLAESRGAVEPVLFDLLQRAVGHAWAHGWQPADLARFVDREHGAREVRLVVDAMAADMRTYAPATVDERWEAQLTAAGAAVWWERDDRYLDDWRGREGLDREPAIECAVDVLALLDVLSPLPELCPPPGKARRGGLGADQMAGRRVDPRKLDRVRALLAKAESTTYPEEAEAFTAKAQELMARHSIDYALLEARAESHDEPAGRRVGVDNPYEAPKALLLDAVSGANRCRSVWMQRLGFATVLGYPPDLDAVELLYTSLLVQATAAMTYAGSRRDASGRSRTRSFRTSFLTAYASRIRQRLADATESVTREASVEAGRGELVPLLAARDDAVRHATEAMFPEVVGRSMTVTNREGWVAGVAAANAASLGIRGELT